MKMYPMWSRLSMAVAAAIMLAEADPCGAATIISFTGSVTEANGSGLTIAPGDPNAATAIYDEGDISGSGFEVASLDKPGTGLTLTFGDDLTILASQAVGFGSGLPTLNFDGGVPIGLTLTVEGLTAFGY